MIILDNLFSTWLFTYPSSAIFILGIIINSKIKLPNINIGILLLCCHISTVLLCSIIFCIKLPINYQIFLLKKSFFKFPLFNRIVSISFGFLSIYAYFYLCEITMLKIPFNIEQLNCGGVCFNNPIFGYLFSSFLLIIGVDLVLMGALYIKKL